MNHIQQYIVDHQLDAMRLAGRKVGAGRTADRRIAVFNPYSEQQIGSVPNLFRLARSLNTLAEALYFELYASFKTAGKHPHHKHGGAR